MSSYYARRTRSCRRNVRVMHGLVLATIGLLTVACSNDVPKQAASEKPGNHRPMDVAAGDTASSAGPTADEHTEAGDHVTLTPDAMHTADIVVQRVDAQLADVPGEELEVPGQVESDPRRIALVSSRIAGRIEGLNVVEGDRVRAGQPVAQLFSTEFLVVQADVQQAVRRAGTLAGTPDETGARALVNAARQRLRLTGASEADVEALVNGGEVRTTLALRAPISGSIITRHVLPGAGVEPGTPVLTVADLSVIDVVAEVPERAIPLVRIGQRATVSIAAFPEMRVNGEVERLKDALNPETRTLQAVIHVVNRAGRLRPGMFASVRLLVSTRASLSSGAEGRGTASLLIVPDAAIVTDGERRFVFVETALRSFQRREVRIAPLAPPGAAAQRVASVVVTDGLRAGERIVIQGAFTLKSELAKAALADDH